MDKLKWCIKRTDENAQEVNAWVNKTFDRNYLDYRDYIHSEIDSSGYYISFSIRPGFHEITIHEFRLLTDPEFTNNVIFEQPIGMKDLIFTDKNGDRVICSDIVFNEIKRMWKQQSHYSAPEVTTTLDPVTEYQTKGPDGKWRIKVDTCKANDPKAFEETVKKRAEFQKNLHRMQGVISELNYLIKVQRKALKQAKKLRDKLNAETNY